VWGTYLHGLFENDVLRTQLLTWINKAAITENQNGFSYRAFKEQNYEILASVVEQQVNTAYILQKIELP
jgi:adenosylcobyric acid synthase